MSPEIRIAGGRFKGRRLTSFGGTYRPTAAIVKKSLFDILGEDIESSRFLDLFAGSGAVGLEALSRGAGFVCFVESDPARAAVVRKNLDALGVEGSWTELFICDYSQALRKLGKRAGSFNIVYVDPPYKGTVPRRILADIVASRVLDSDGVVVFETARRDVRRLLENAPIELYPLRERALGGSALVFFRWRNKTPAETDTPQT